MKKVVLVGHCGADSSYLRIAVAGAAAGLSVVAADDQEALSAALQNGVELILINRVLDWGFDEEEGVELIARLRQTHPQVKTMLVSNYADAQAAAIAAGALPGFGKREIGTPKVKELLQSALAQTSAAARAL
jgi:two-component system, chemotaxis family, chemotaxis protein CheY